MSQLLYPDSKLQFNSQMILCIEELDDIDNVNYIDTRVFIGWNQNRKEYFVRGKRLDKSLIAYKYVPYGFFFKNKDELISFLSIVMDKKAYKNITYYNFNNILDKNEYDLTFEFFENNMNSYYEICGYDRVKIKKSKFNTYLDILEKSHN